MSIGGVIFVAIASSAVLAGCGESSQVDQGGFTANERKAAQRVLDSLRVTSIPTALVTLTHTAQSAPSVCRVHLESKNPRTFTLFVFWTPFNVEDAPYTWLAARLREHVLEDSIHVGHSDANASKAEVLRSHAGNAFAKPVETCQVLMNGYLRLVD
jgi:hypothetical protein